VVTGAGADDDGARTGRHRHQSVHPPDAWLVTARWFARVVATLVSITLLLGFGYGWYNYRDLNNNLRRLQINVPQAANHRDIDGADQNILIVGNDDRSDMTDAEVRELKTGRDGGSLATDTMMIVHVPANGSKATLISLPRDSYVEIPGYGMNKLNSAYADAYTNSSGSTDQKRAAGATLLEHTIEDLTGLSIDHYVQVNLLGFYRISNAIGGVTVDLCESVDDAEGSHLKLSAGRHTIEGVQALEFVRQRKGLPRGDIDRVARQRYFLTAAFRKISSAGILLNPGRLHDLVQAVDNSLYVDSTFDILAFAKQISGLNADNIRGQTIPYVDERNVPGVGDVEIIDPDQVKQFVANLLGQGQDVLGKAKAADPHTVSVQVLNGGTENGAAQRNATLLRGYGFTATFSTAPATSAATTVEYAKGTEAQVKALLKYLPANVVLVQKDVPVVTLVLGADGLSVKAPASASTSASATTSPVAKPKPLDSGCIN
jgi:LCP family protein required for cell wall assembly